MKPAIGNELIDVDDLRVGMFVHLDLNWMSHPFPLGSFRISNAEQVATIRSLGLQRVRWAPAQSDAPNLFGLAGGRSQPAPLDALGPPDTTLPSGSAAPAARLAGVAPAAAGSPESQQRDQHRQRLAEQRQALRVCERQFAEAAQDCRRLTEMVTSQPVQARVGIEQLTKALVGKMLGEQELCIRILSEAAGDKASAHALNVTIISLLMGRTFGLSDTEMLELGVGALLHDIGKLDLPDRLRHRDDRFNVSDQRFYEDHVAHGVSHARKMGLTPGALLVIAQHHEHADGSGFPMRLNSDRTTAASRIVALVNHYDNLCNPNVPSRALTPHESLSLMFAQGKDKFETSILGTFIRMMGVYPSGSTVQLTDDRYAMVMGVNASRPLKPRVLVHDAGVPREEALIVDLESAQGLGIRRSIKPTMLPPASLQYLSPRARVAYFFEPLAVARQDALAA